MALHMLIDAAHPEEVRVAVVKGNKLEDFDFEATARKPLKGNIYLAKVTRVEPSLQAAFVDYGGNRHGFLAFSEIHPDYYQIPVADREALLVEQMEEDAREAEIEDKAAESGARDTASRGDGADDGEDINVEDVGGDVLDERPRRRAQVLRAYKIQEVIKRRQIMLVQVVKEERGNKGAALTSYLSLAGRYCVLMPNTARGGGISRKITQPTDRKRLKSIVTDLEVPEGMGLIIRTAGLQRTKSDIKRDFEYLLKMWEQIRELTLKSTAPRLIYEEANLITRSIRDVYTKDIDEILVEGEDGYKTAKSFMRLLMPSHAKRVKRYKEQVPLFHRYQVEQQLDSMYTPSVTLPSGGYIVMNVTEALVAIDVNSGKATKGRNIEETALKTNLEASEEIGRQLRLRDLAGLIVIDYIDMEESRNSRAVERKLKECLRQDRARIQVGRISHFGLLEMSRQRLRPSVQEMTMEPCRQCGGTGIVRSTESTALHILRAIEEEGIRGRAQAVTVHMPTAAALYIFNHKRATLAEIEARYGLRVQIEGDDTLVSPEHRIVRGKAEAARPVAAGPIQPALQEREEIADEDETEEFEADEDKPAKRRRRRRRKTAEPEAADEAVAAADDEAVAADDEASATGEEAGAPGEEDESPKRRRRGRRGGRRRGRTKKEAATEAEPVTSEAEPVAAEREPAEAEPAAATPVPPEPVTTAPASAPLAAEAEAAEAEAASAEGPATAGEPAGRAPEPVSEFGAVAVGEGAPRSNGEGDAPPKAVGEGPPQSGSGYAETAEAPAESGRDATWNADLVAAAETGDRQPAKPKKKRTGWWRRGRAD